MSGGTTHLHANHAISGGYTQEPLPQLSPLVGRVSARQGTERLLLRTALSTASHMNIPFSLVPFGDVDPRSCGCLQVDPQSGMLVEAPERGSNRGRWFPRYRTYQATDHHGAGPEDANAAQVLSEMMRRMTTVRISPRRGHIPLEGEEEDELEEGVVSNNSSANSRRRRGIRIRRGSLGLNDEEIVVLKERMIHVLERARRGCKAELEVSRERAWTYRSGLDKQFYWPSVVTSGPNGDVNTARRPSMHSPVTVQSTTPALEAHIRSLLASVESLEVAFQRAAQLQQQNLQMGMYLRDLAVDAIRIAIDVHVAFCPHLRVRNSWRDWEHSTALFRGRSPHSTHDGTSSYGFGTRRGIGSNGGGHSRYPSLTPDTEVGEQANVPTVSAASTFPSRGRSDWLRDIYCNFDIFRSYHDPTPAYTRIAPLEPVLDKNPPAYNFIRETSDSYKIEANFTNTPLMDSAALQVLVFDDTREIVFGMCETQMAACLDLPQDADLHNVRAKARNGVLTITVAKIV